MTIWFISGLASIIVAVAIYLLILWRFGKSFLGLSKWQTIAHLVSHVPDDSSPAFPHILGGVLLCLGVCLVIGASIPSLPFFSKDLNNHGIALTAGALAFGVLISIISFWTLWQTKRIEQIQGSTLEGFPHLIEAIAEELDRINNDFRQNGGRARPHHRFHIVTTNPFFGVLSDKGGKPTELYEDAVLHAARRVKASSADGAGEGFQLEILCGTTGAINEFHRYFYRPPKKERAEPDDPAVVEATNETERFLARINEEAGKNVVFRANTVPTTQFAIVGNSVFEFILESPGLQTEIHQARRIQDRIVCDRFKDTFHLLKRLGELDAQKDPDEVLREVGP